jgi:hypothetical protein
MIAQHPIKLAAIRTGGSRPWAISGIVRVAKKKIRIPVPMEVAMKALVVIATTSALIVSAQAAVLAPISPQRALSYRRQCVMVEGMASVRKDPNRLGTDVDIDGEKSPFLGYILPGDESQFSKLNSYVGKIVDITGIVQFYQGRAEIKMTSANQIKLASPNKESGGLTHIDPSFAISGSVFCGSN